MSERLVEHFFRREYGRLVASLSRRVGVRDVELAEDAAQTALARALDHWSHHGPPDNPAAWLFRVAHNVLVGELRQRSTRARILDGVSAPDAEPPVPALLAGEVKDDLLRMLFVCCDEVLPVESQIVVALKILCGFSVAEIARRLFTTEANVYKRLTRARHRLRDVLKDGLDAPPDAARLPGVQRVIYLVFTEGYLSSHAQLALRRDLCDEALRLGLLLAEHPVGATPETEALVALMHLHAARLAARDDGAGGLVLLEDQDRSRWDRDRIATGLVWLARSARGDVFSRYHAEARIAAEHGLAETFEATRWDVIAETYAHLEQIAPSPLVTLNRALAVAQVQGPEAGLAIVSGRALEPPTWLAGSHQWSAVLADLHRRCGHEAEADRYRALALAAAPNDAVRSLLERRLGPARH